MELNITDADIKVATKANEANIVTLHYSIVSLYEDKGQVGKFDIEIPNVSLARELFDRYKRKQTL